MLSCTFIHTQTYSYMHSTHIQIHMNTHRHSYPLANSTHMHAYLNTHKITQLHAGTQNTYMHSHAGTQTHAHACECTCTHIHSLHSPACIMLGMEREPLAVTENLRSGSSRWTCAVLHLEEEEMGLKMLSVEHSASPVTPTIRCPSLSSL